MYLLAAIETPFCSLTLRTVEARDDIACTLTDPYVRAVVHELPEALSCVLVCRGEQ